MVREPWIGLISVIPSSSAEGDLLDQALGAFVNVVALAATHQGYVASATAALRRDGFEVTEIAWVGPLRERSEEVDQSLEDIARKLERRGRCGVWRFPHVLPGR